MKQEDPKYEVKCGASWQVIGMNGVAGKLKCRFCKTVVASGGTPKCLKK